MRQMSDSIVTTIRLSGQENHGCSLLRSPVKGIGRIGMNQENAGALPLTLTPPRP
jgi:hypothetical protein